MPVTKAYYYLFYKLYKFSEAAPSRWLSDWKAVLVIDVLEYLFLFSLEEYYSMMTKRDLLPVANPMALIVLVAFSIIALNYFIFNHKDKWKPYVKEFDKWSRRKNLIGSFCVIFFIMLNIANIIYMFCLMSRIDWAKYR